MSDKIGFSSGTRCVDAGDGASRQPKVVNAKFNTEPSGAGALSATVNRFQHSNSDFALAWLSEVAAVPGSHFSMCSGDTESSMDDGCCGVLSTREIRAITFDLVRRGSDDTGDVLTALQWCGLIRRRWTRFVSVGDRVPELDAGRISAVYLADGCKGGRQRRMAYRVW